MSGKTLEPDMYVLGKALGGGVFPISCVVANEEILRCIQSGFTWFYIWWKPNGLCSFNCFIEVLEDEKLAEHSLELGELLYG